MRPTTVLLDSNVWRHLVEYSSVSELARWARRSGATIQIAPGVVYEALRTGDPALRRQLILFMTDAAWERLMPEAFEECQEILAEVQQLRPEWLRPQPNSALLHRTRYDWVRPSGGFWDRLRFSTDAEAAIVRALEHDTMDVARGEAYGRRTQVHSMGLDKAMLNLSAMTATLADPLAGWDGKPLQPWRVDALGSVTRALRTARQKSHPYFDWLSPLMDIDAALGAVSSWNRFWLHDARPERMPRQWIRWAFERLTSTRRVSNGTPCDIQLATYLLSCDYFVSADRPFCQLIEDCRPHFALLPKVLRIESGREGVSSLGRFLKAADG